MQRPEAKQAFLHTEGKGSIRHLESLRIHWQAELPKLRILDPASPHLKENNNNRILTAALRVILQFPLQGRVTPAGCLPVPFRNYFLQPAGDTVGGRRAGQRKSL